MTEAAIQARNVLCILHDEPEAIRELCSEFSGYEYDTEFSGQGPDHHMVNSFNVSDNTVRPSLMDSDYLAITRHQNVAYVLSPRLDAPSALAEARCSLNFVSCCFDLGARAAKCETAGLTHGKDTWLELAEQEEDAALYWAWVRRPLADDSVVYSCGMHILGFADVEVVDEEPSDALELIDVFAMYLLIDKPGELLQSNHRFSKADDAPKYHVVSSVCSRYEDDEFFYNPHGYWQLEAIR